MKMCKKILSVCLLALCMLFVGKTDTKAATYTLPVSDNWTDGELTQRGGYNYYRVTIPEAGTLTIRYQGLSIGYSYAYIYDEDLTECYEKSNLLGNTSVDNPKTEDVIVDLQKGAYMVRIHGHAGSATGTYRLKAMFKSAESNEKEPNDSFAAAMPLSGIPTIHGMLAENEDYDFYRFSLSKKTPVKIRYVNYYNPSMPEPGVDGIVDIYNSNYEVLKHQRPINRDFLFEETLSPGTYYIKISKFYGGSGKYILQYSVKTPTPHYHVWDSGKITRKATCTQTGEKVYTCLTCKETKKEVLAKVPHVYRTTITKATTKANGKIVQKCVGCTSAKTSTIPFIKSLKLSKTTYTYNGKKQTPSVTVTDAKGKRISASNYFIGYYGSCKTVGTYKVVVQLTGKYYSGSLSGSFKINPYAPKISSLKALKKGFSVKWKKQSSSIASGYQVQYSTRRDFKGSKTVRLSSYKKYSLNKTGLSAKRRYYVRVRTYKTVSGKNYYSSWSPAKTVTTK